MQPMQGQSVDLNDPRLRLTALNQSNPSVRVSVAPAQNLRVGNQIVTRDPNLKTGGPVYEPSADLVQRIVSDTVNPVSKFGNDLSAAGALIQPNRASINTREAQAASFVAPGGGLGHQGGTLGGNELDSNNAIFLGPNAKQNILKTVGEGGQLAADLVGGGEDSVVKSIIGGAIANTVGTGSQELGDTGTLDPKALTISGVAGGFLGAGGHLVGNTVKSVANKLLVNKLVKSNDVEDITNKLAKVAPNADPTTLSDIAGHIANESDSKTVKALVDYAKNPGEGPLPSSNKNTELPPEDIQAIKDAGGTVSDLNTPAFQRGAPTTVGEAAAQHQLGVDNLDQSVLSGNERLKSQSLEGDSHLDSPAYIRKNPDGVIADAEKRIAQIDEQLKSPKSAEEAKFNAKQKLAEDLRAHPGARDAIMQDYKRRVDAFDAGSVDNNTVQLTAERNRYERVIQKAQEVKGLPEDHVAAIKAAGGEIPKTGESALHIPKTNSYAKLTEEQLNILKDENKNIPFSEGDMPHLTNVEKLQQSGAKEVTQEELAAQSPNVKKALENASSVAPAEAAKTEEAVDNVPVQSGAEPTPSTGEDVAKSATENTKDIPNSTPEVKDAVTQVMNSLDPASEAYKKAAQYRTAEKGARIMQGKAAYEAAGGGTEGLSAKLATLKNKYSESGFQPLTNIPDEAQKTLLDSVESNKSLSEWDKLNTQVALQKVFGKVEGKPTPGDIELIRQHFGEDMAKSIEDSVAASGKTGPGELIGQLAGAPKSIMASYDISGTLRQGGPLATRFPKEAAAAFKDELKYFASKDSFEKGMEEISSRPTFKLMKDSDLAVSGAEKMTASEEQFVSNIAEKIPGFGKGIEASDRAYSGFLTKLRADVFDSIVKGESATRELSDKDLKGIADYINTFSGRGDLGPWLEQHSQTLTTALFSPRLWKSRLDMLNPVYYAKLSPVARKYALQNAGSFAVTASTILGLASLAGAQVGMDPRSADFGKIKVGNTRYDILGGLQQNIVFAYREIVGQKKNSETGAVTDLTKGKFGAADRLSTLTDMIQNKENPLLAAGQHILQGHDRGGNPVNPFTEVAKLAIPLPFQGAYQTAQDIGSAKNPGDLLKGAAMNLPDTFGVSAQTYGSIPTKNKGKPNAQGFPDYTGKIADNMVTDNNGKVILDAKGKPITVTFPAGATPLQKKAMLDARQTSALSEQYKANLTPEDRTLTGLSDQQLKQYVKDGTIDQGHYDYIKNQQKGANTASNGISVPDGAKSQVAQNFYKQFNSMDKKDQDYWLNKQGPDQNGKDIAAQLNQQKSKGLSDFKPSNQLSKAYAEYENDINTHPEYTEVDKRNKAKAFQTFATKLNYNQNVKDIFAEGGSVDLKTLIAGKHVDKKDLDAAMKLDDELYTSGLTSSLKFSTKFREAYGYGLPATYGSSGAVGGAGSSKTTSTNGELSTFASAIKTGSTSPVPQFSAASRQNPITSIKFNGPTLPGGQGDRITVAPYRTISVKRLANNL